MSLIDEQSRIALANKFEAQMKRPVTVEVYQGEDNPQTTDFSIKLLEELAELNSSIHYEVKPIDDAARELGVTASPTLLVGREHGYRLEYWGAPLGMEAEAFIDTIIMASTGEHGLSQTSESLLGLLDQEVRLYSFVTPTCPYCPRSVVQNHKLAVARPGKVRSIAVEAQENLELAQRFNVSSVPQQLFNEDSETISVGAQPEQGYVRSVLSYAGVQDGAMDAVASQIAKAMTQLADNPDHPIHVSDQTFQEAVERYPLMVVDCWAEWCGPCRMVAPVIDALAKDLQGKVVFAKLDTEANPAISSQYAIHSIPTLLVFKGGRLVDRLVGFRPKPALKKELEKHISAAN